MNIVLLGAPNVGKGTYAGRLSEKLEIPHISTGDMLREIAKQDTDLGKKVKDLIEKGEFVSDEDMFAVLYERLQQNDCKNGYILDGFPRTLPQAELLETNKIGIDHVLNYVASDEVIMARMEGRVVCKQGHIYHLINNPPQKAGICDIDGEEVARRADDTPEIMKERLKKYHLKTAPLIEYYQQKEVLSEIDANGGFAQVDKIIGESLDALGV